MREKLDLLLRSMLKYEGSDLHLKANAIPRARIHGKLKPLGREPLSANEIEAMIAAIASKEMMQKFHDDRNLDMTYVMGEESRFRVNAFYQLTGISVVMRVIPVKIPDFNTLGLPEVIRKFSQLQRGLVLVTGVTGSGKSTTLASLIDIINRTEQKHIITIEDPIEFVHQDKQCLLNQRSVGQDTHSFSDALRAALREDPDIILVGEMRDLETIDIALHAANTGHLVFSTLHTLDAKETIDRIVGMFEKEEQNRIRLSLASVLEGVVSQRLVPTVRGGRAAAVEVLVKTARIEQLIRENRDYEIPDAIYEGKEIYGTQTFDQSLLDLLKEGTISEETALEYASNPADMKLKLEGVGADAVTEKRSESLEYFDLKEEEA